MDEEKKRQGEKAKTFNVDAVSSMLCVLALVFFFLGGGGA
jgi:hypothetical protein